MENFKIKKFIYILIIIVFPLKSYGQTFGFDADRAIGFDHDRFIGLHNYWNNIHEIKEKHDIVTYLCSYGEKYKNEQAYVNVFYHNNWEFINLDKCKRERITAINFYAFKKIRFHDLLIYLDSFPNIVKVNIVAPSSCKLIDLPDKFYTYTRIKALAINANIENISSNISKLRNLEYLQIASDSLKNLPDSINQLDYLKYFYLSGNLCIDKYLEVYSNASKDNISFYMRRYFFLFPDYISYRSANPSQIKNFDLNYNQLKSLYLNVKNTMYFKKAEYGRKYFDFFYVSSKAVFHKEDNIYTDFLLLDKESYYNNITINQLYTDSIQLIKGLKKCRVNNVSYCIGTKIPDKFLVIKEINKSKNKCGEINLLQRFSFVNHLYDQKFKVIKFGRYYNPNKIFYNGISNIKTDKIILISRNSNWIFNKVTNENKNLTFFDSLIINVDIKKLNFSNKNFVNILKINNSKVILKNKNNPIIDSMFIIIYNNSFKNASINFLQIDSLSDLNQLELNVSVRSLKILKISSTIDTIQFIQYINKLKHIERVCFPWMKNISHINMLNNDFKIELKLTDYLKYMKELRNKKITVFTNATYWKQAETDFNPNLTIELSY